MFLFCDTADSLSWLGEIVVPVENFQGGIAGSGKTRGMNAQLSPTSLAPDTAVDQFPTGPVPGAEHTSTAPDVKVLFPLGSSRKTPAWLVTCSGETAEHLQLPPGPYTLVPMPSGQSKAPERLCSLPALPAVARVDAISQGQDSADDQIWVEPLEAGTLADYCAAKGAMPLGQVVSVAGQLIQGLDLLHSHQMAYRDLTADSLAFTMTGDLKLLPPDKDLRAADEATVAKAIADDTGACAGILWQCLTGEKPVAQRLRTPLPIAAPGTSEAMAETLENAIDRRAQQPTLAQIASLFELADDPQPLELHLSAHPSVHHLLPTLQPAEPTPVRRKFRKKSQVRETTKNLNRPAGRNLASPKIFQTAAGKTGKTGRRLPPRVQVVGALCLVLAAGGYLAFQFGLPGQDAHQQATPAPTPDTVVAAEIAVEEESPAAEASPGEQPSVPAAQAAAPEMEENQDLAQILADLISVRSQALTDQAPERIADYAVAGGGVDEADRTLLQDPDASQLAHMQTSLHSIESITPGPGGDSFTALIYIQSVGYTPQGPSAELAEQGIEVRDGIVLQKARIEAKKQEGKYLLHRAEAVSLAYS